MNYLGIKPEEIQKTTDSLNELLANYQVYYQNLRRFHWNIKGKEFFDLHVKFEDLYNEAKVNIDEIAERILTLRKTPMGTMANYLKESKITEKETLDSETMVITILENHSVLIKAMRKVLDNASSAKDEGTTDLVAGFLSTMEKNSWMLDAYIQQ